MLENPLLVVVSLLLLPWALLSRVTEWSSGAHAEHNGLHHFLRGPVPELVSPRCEKLGHSSSLSLGAAECLLKQYSKETVAETDCTITE